MFSSFTRGASAVKVFSSSSVPVDEVLSREDLAEIIMNADGPGQRAMLSYTERNLPRILAAAQKVSAKLQHTSNAAALLVRCIQTHPNQAETIRRIVPSTISVFARKGLTPAPVASACQRILLAAFEEDFSDTSYGVNIALGDEIVHGAIRNLATSTVVGETLISLFGSALNANTIMLPSTTPNIFTDVWIKHGFPFHVASYCRIAMSSFECQPYFTFMIEAIKRGMSHSAGPIVDQILQKTAFTDMLQAVLECSEANVQQLKEAPSETSPYPLASDGVALIASILALVRKSFPPTETPAQYKATIRSSAPLMLVVENLKRFVMLLQGDASSSRVGLTKLAVLDVISELVQTNIHGLDAALCEAQAIQVVFELWESFPHNDFVSRSVERMVMSVFSRKGNPISASHDNLLTSLMYVDGETYLSKLREWCVSTTLANTSLQATALNLVMELHETPWFSTQGARLEGFFVEVLQLHCAERVHQWMSPITGSAYASRGSGCPGFVTVHRPPSNPQNVHANVSNSDSSSELDEEERMPLANQARRGVNPLPCSSDDASLSSSAGNEVMRQRLSAYVSANGDAEDDDLEVVGRPFDDGFGFRDFSEGDDVVNIDDADPIEKAHSLDRCDDDEWVEQTIQDVSTAVDGGSP